MITISVSAQRVFSLPADVGTAFSYFYDFKRTIEDLPHLDLVKVHAPNQYRILYSTAEAGVYRVALYCDLQLESDVANQIIRVTPLEGIASIPAKVTLNSLTGQGTYTSQSLFRAAGAMTSVHYQVVVNGRLPKPLGLKFVPDQIVQRLIENLVYQRLQEITDIFILRSINRLRDQI
jgi:hypothetical protein